MACKTFKMHVLSVRFAKIIMRILVKNIVLSVIIGCLVQQANGQNDPNDSHAMVALRMIGHRLLLQSGDSSSRVLPIQKVNGRFLLQFESELGFDPGVLAGTVDSILSISGLANSYLVEIQSCETQEIVYSYEVFIPNKSDIIPCSDRLQPKACYKLYFTLFHPKEPVKATKTSIWEGKRNLIANWQFLLGAGLFFALLSILYLRKRNAHAKQQPLSGEITDEILSIGTSRFDKKNMRVWVNNEQIDLTGKEAELLLLLHNATNKTLDREDILQEVWGDDGDYTGRTLDVFVSKLRKKLEGDPTIRIINIRGVGYKMVTNSS